jgi:hypothetical protein
MPLAAAWVIAMILPLTSGAFWPTAAAEVVRGERATTFSSDPISVLPIRGGEWVVQPWLPALVMRAAFDLFDTTGLVLLQGLLAVALVALAWRLARTQAGPVPAVFALGVAIGLLWPTTIRTEQFALVVGVLLLLCVRSRYWLLAPVLLALWANVHGSVPLGLFIAGCAALGMNRPSSHESVMPIMRAGLLVRLAWLLACALAVLASPLGVDIVAYVRDVQDIPTLEQVTPLWQPLRPISLRGALVIASVCMLVYVQVRRRDRSGLLALLPVLVLVVATFGAVRYASWLALVATPELAFALGWWFERRRLGDRLTSPIIATALLAPLVFAALLLLPGTPAQQRLARLGLPSSKLLEEVHDGDVAFTSAEWADYVYLRTGAPVVVDARLERFRDRDLRDYVAFTRRADLDLVRRSHADVVLVHDRTIGALWGELDETIEGSGLRLDPAAQDEHGARFDVVDGDRDRPALTE